MPCTNEFSFFFLEDGGFSGQLFNQNFDFIQNINTYCFLVFLNGVQYVTATNTIIAHYMMSLYRFSNENVEK